MVKHPKKILLAVDSSSQAYEAVRYISRLLPPERTKVVLFNVMTKIPDCFWDIEEEPANRQKEDVVSAWELEQNKDGREFMEKVRRLFLDRNFPEDAISIKIQQKKVGIARDIVLESQNDYDGVVVGRWGTSMLKDFLCGSITNKLVERLTHVPICVVGGAPKIGKILVALDASEGAMRSLDYIAAMVDGPDWQFTLFHAIRDLDRKELQRAEKSISSVFETASDHLEKAGFKRNQITTRTVANVPSRAGALVVEALSGEYGTIVVGRRGLSCVEEFAMGRVSNKVIQMARTIAVWVVI